MELWQQFLVYLGYTIIGGIIVGVVVHYLRQRGAKRDKLLSAMRNILVELDTNMALAKQPFQGRLVPFATKMWDDHKGEILALPEDTQTALHQVYIKVQGANALVQSNLQLSYGLGYYNKEYQEKCNEIAGRAEKAIELLRSWLEQEV